ncbi:MAG: type II toxin-antitoxin system VapC family toxin [Intrasporangiaceae bacterium]|nr:type II toxin-antitoxin system VapC family toxin [Intrasporangiaceae bacterium]
MNAILDTNVVSELMRPAGDVQLRAWVDGQAPETLFLTSINVAEIRIGIALLVPGRRRQILADRFESELLPKFGDRVLPFDVEATGPHAEIVARSRRAGRPVSHFDALIGAIAYVRGMSVVTHDTAPFETAGVAVLNPWEA